MLIFIDYLKLQEQNLRELMEHIQDCKTKNVNQECSVICEQAEGIINRYIPMIHLVKNDFLGL